MLRAFRLLPVALIFFSADSLAAPSPHPGVPPTPASERMADALRFWTEVRLFSMAPGAGGIRWERALVEEAPSLLGAPSDPALKSAAERMLARIDQTPQSVGKAAMSSAPALRSEAGVIVLGCASLGSESVTTSSTRPRARPCSHGL